MHEKHEQLGEFGAIPGAPNGPPVSATPPFPAASQPPSAVSPLPAFRQLPSAFLQFLPVRDLPVIAHENAEWIWDGFLARKAVTLLSSEPKAGKSTLIFGLMQKLLCGEPFLGRTTRSPGVPPGPKSEDDAAPAAPDEVTGRDARTTDAATETPGRDAHATTPCGVIYFSEEPLGTLREKAERFELHQHGERIQLVSRRCAQNRNVSLDTALRDALAKAAAIGAGLIVIDTLSAWAGWRSEEENSAGPCETLMAKFRDAAAQSNTAVLLLHHTRKDKTSPRGSSVLTGSADIILFLERKVFPAMGERRQPSILKTASRFSDAPDPVSFELTESGYQLSNPVVAANRKHAELFELLPPAPPGKTREELCAESGFSRWKVRCALNDLLAQQSVRTSGTGENGSPLRYHRAC
jgi:hypothetical protein